MLIKETCVCKAVFEFTSVSADPLDELVIARWKDWIEHHKHCMSPPVEQAWRKINKVQRSATKPHPGGVE